MSALGIVANKGGCRAIRSIISRWEMHSFRVKIKYLTLFVPRLLMISPHITSVEDFRRKNPIVSVFFVIFSNNTGDWATDPGARECVRSAHFSNTPDAARTILACGLFELLSMIRTEKVVVLGNEGQDIGEKMS